MKHALVAAIFACFFGSTAAFAEELHSVLLVIKNGHLYPEKLEVPANTKFRLEIRNEGPGAAEFESMELKKETVLSEGVTRKLVFYPLKPGTYKFFDEFHSATAQGLMIAK